MRLCSYADMQICGYVGIRQGITVIGHVVLWSAATRHLAVGFVFTSYAAKHRVSILVLLILIAIGN